MAVNWRGWRPIVVNGERFRWQCLFGCPCGCSSSARCVAGEAPNLVRVRSEAVPSRLLTVSGSWNCFGIVLPGNVAEWIGHAQARGWCDEHRALHLRLTDQPGVPDIVVVG